MASRLTPRPTEWLLGGYGALVVVVSLARAPDNPATLWIAAAHLLLLVLLGLFQRVPPGGAGELLRTVAPVVLLLGLYGSLDVLNGHGARPTHDGLVRGWEQALFGGQPSRDWWRAMPSQVWSAVFHAAYFGYYVIVPFPIVWCLAMGRHEAARRAVFTIMAAFLICYVSFLFFPVAGPYYEFRRPDAWFVANGPARLVYGVLAGGSSFGAAFPSSHVAGTWAAVLATAAVNTRAGWALAGPAILLTVGVVYCQMHYAVDALAGLGVAGLAALAAARGARSSYWRTSLGGPRSRAPRPTHY